MVLNPIATLHERSKHSTSSKSQGMSDSMIDQLYNVNQERYKKYKKMTKKYITMNQTTNPQLNSHDNTVYYVKNESEHEKNSEKLYKNNTQHVK
jgi:hypothetical protein